MGLLNKVSGSGLVKENQKPVPAAVKDTPPVKKSNSVGLLKKSLNLANSNDRLDFFEFLDKYNIQLCAVFNSQNDVYCVDYSAGLDGESICCSVSTKDFWNGINNNQTLDPLPFYQFFSSQLKDSIKNLKVYKKSNGQIYLYCTPDSNTALLNKDIEKLNEVPFTFNTSSLSKGGIHFQIDYQEAIESLVLSNTKSSEKHRLMDSISRQLYFNLLKYFPAPSNVIFVKSGVFKIELNKADELPFEVISNHLRLESSFVLGKHSELISIEAE